MSVDPASPGAVDGDADADSRSARNIANNDAAVLDEECAAGLPWPFAACEVEAVFGDRDTERARQVAGPTTEIGFVDGAAVAGAPLLHQRDAVERLQCANEDRGRMPVGFRDGVHEVMNAVVQIDVGKARRSIERLVARRAAERSVARRIVFADVRLGLDDHTGGRALPGAMDEYLAKPVTREKLVAMVRRLAPALVKD